MTTMEMSEVRRLRLERGGGKWARLEAAVQDIQDDIDEEHGRRMSRALDIMSGQSNCPMNGDWDDGEAVPCDECIEHRPGGHELMVERMVGENMTWHTYDGHCKKCPVGAAVVS